MEFSNIFDLDIARPTAAPEVAAREDREARCTRNLFTLLETRGELRGVYAPADAIAETLRWSA
jgi:hypothetical protein